MKKIREERRRKMEPRIGTKFVVSLSSSSSKRCCNKERRRSFKGCKEKM